MQFSSGSPYNPNFRYKYFPQQLILKYIQSMFLPLNDQVSHSCKTTDKITVVYVIIYGVGQLSQYSDWLRAGRSGDRIPVGARFSAPVQTVPGAHPAFFTMGTGSFPGVKQPGRGADHPPVLVPRPGECRAIPLPHIWALESVMGYLYLYLFVVIYTVLDERQEDKDGVN
jgi:hypothetical protein